MSVSNSCYLRQPNLVVLIRHVLEAPELALIRDMTLRGEENLTWNYTAEYIIAKYP